MLFALIFSWETIVVVFCLLILSSGLVRVTMRRQTEILKEYLQPEKLKVEQLIMRSEVPPPESSQNQRADDADEQDFHQGAED